MEQKVLRAVMVCLLLMSMAILGRDSFHWPETPDELQKVTMKEMHWLCDGLSLTPKGAFEERHPKIVV